MKFKVNLGLVLIIFILILVILFIDERTLSSLYYNYDENFIVKEVNTGNRETSIVYNEVNVERVNDDVANNSVNVVMVDNNVDKWVWPTVSGYVITNYFNSYHNAIDISSGYGSHVYAVNSGVVTSVMGGCVTGNLSCNGKGGNYVVVKHNSNNYYTVYMHLKDITVSLGQNVSSGQVIGTMGNTGNVIPVPSSSNPYAGTHLHFCLYIGEPYKGGYAINPMILY